MRKLWTGCIAALLATSFIFGVAQAQQNASDAPPVKVLRLRVTKYFLPDNSAGDWDQAQAAALLGKIVEIRPGAISIGGEVCPHAGPPERLAANALFRDEFFTPPQALDLEPDQDVAVARPDCGPGVQAVVGPVNGLLYVIFHGVSFTLTPLAASSGAEPKPRYDSPRLPDTAYKEFPSLNLVVGRPTQSGYANDMEPSQVSLGVEITPIDALEGVGDLDADEAREQRDALAKGQLGPEPALGAEGLAEVASIDRLGVNAVVYPVFGASEVCSTLFLLQADFYLGDQRVRITSAAPPEKMIDESPGFFGKAPANCGDDPVWLAGKSSNSTAETWKRFYHAAMTDELGPMARLWVATMRRALDTAAPLK